VLGPVVDAGDSAECKGVRGPGLRLPGPLHLPGPGSDQFELAIVPSLLYGSQSIGPIPVLEGDAPPKDQVVTTWDLQYGS
jgi:hypothetical protein